MKISKVGILLFGFILLLMMPYTSHAAKVVIDPGHGGSDPGAIGVNGLKEKDVNMDISNKVLEELIHMGYDAILTRSKDTSLSLQQRVDFTNLLKPDLFVSIHANSHPNPKVRGSMVLYYDSRYPQKNYPASSSMIKLSPQSKKLAQTVQNALLAEAGTEDRGLMPSAAYVIRMGNVPSILVETAFLSNWNDAEMLANADQRTNMAKGIALGISRYLPTKYQDVGTHWAKRSIEKMKESGIMVGYGHKFLPNHAISRAELLATLDRVFYFTALENNPHAPEPDVSVEPVQSRTEGTEDEQKLDDSQEKIEVENADDVEILSASGKSQVSPSQDLATSQLGKSGLSDISDLSQDHWAFDIIEKALELNILQGYPNGTIQPDRSVTRAEASVIFDRVQQLSLGLQPADSDDVIELPFQDVPAHSWASEAIARMKSNNLIQGLNETIFAPHKKMTRAEVSVIIDRYID